MRIRDLLPAVLLAAGCAGRETPPEGDAVPYKAVVAFEWVIPGADPAGTNVVPGAAAGSDPVPAVAGEPSPHLSPGWVENEVLQGFLAFKVFSSCSQAPASRMAEVAEQEKADLLVLVRVGTLVNLDGKSTRVVPGLAVLDALLWLWTGVGAWWVPDREFSNRCEVELRWRRIDVPDGGAPSPRPEGKPFMPKERVASRECRLSLWDRAKPWRYPWAYLLSVLVPPAFVPLQDRREVERSLAVSALEDIKRELARKLKRELRSGGSPFLFQLEEPANGAVVRSESIKLLYRYRVEPGFAETHADKGLSTLSIEVQRGDREGYEKAREYTAEGLRTLNERIARDEVLEEEVHLLPGMNLIRFVARTEFGAEWITNTVALLRQ